MLERAVVNAGPLVALSLLDQLDLLPALFGFGDSLLNVLIMPLLQVCHAYIV